MFTPIRILVGLSNNISLSRCWSGNNNSDTFIVTQMTKNEINNCTRSGHDIQLYLTSTTQCEEISKNLTVLDDVKLWVAKQINAQCHCGMTPNLLEGKFIIFLNCFPLYDSSCSFFFIFTLASNNCDWLSFFCFVFDSSRKMFVVGYLHVLISL